MQILFEKLRCLGWRNSKTIWVFLLCSLYACRKPRTEDPQQLLTGKNWLLHDMQLIQEPLPGTSILTDCNNDNQLRFHDNGMVRYDFGAIKCDSSETRLTYHQWYLGNAKDTLYMGGLVYEVKVLSRTDLRLFLRNYPAAGSGRAVNLYFIYKSSDR